MNAYDRHRRFIDHYVLYYGGAGALATAREAADALPANYTTEEDVIRRHHRFLREDDDKEDDAALAHLSHTQRWEAKLARAYYDRLFKEYALCDMSRYKTGLIAMRWRTQPEVLDGRGQWSCGNVACKRDRDLTSWEVPFRYREPADGGAEHRALVKLRLCPKCSDKLHYRRDRDRKKSGESSAAEDDFEDLLL
ncbi:hypothetical protein H9P43_008652 [Blastocladiella emersonii ATCC 22665]|nr:hypothetical protein H9P43_008652 [Blastocladiella emersonii ATCC 22665]